MWRKAIAEMAVKVALALLKSKFKKSEIAVNIVQEVIDAHLKSQTNS